MFLGHLQVVGLEGFCYSTGRAKHVFQKFGCVMKFQTHCLLEGLSQSNSRKEIFRKSFQMTSNHYFEIILQNTETKVLFMQSFRKR